MQGGQVNIRLMVLMRLQSVVVYLMLGTAMTLWCLFSIPVVAQGMTCCLDLSSSVRVHALHDVWIGMHFAYGGVLFTRLRSSCHACHSVRMSGSVV